MAAPCWRLVLNGKSAGDDALRDAVAAIRDRGVALDVRVTWETGDAQRHVAEAIADGATTIIAAGGDGTLSEVAAALANRADAADALPSIALVPMGTANDFASAAGIPDTPLDAMQLVLEQPPAVVDLLRISADGDVHWAANMASGGFGTDVTVETSEGMKKLLGGLAYVVTGMARLGRIEPVTARFSGPDFEWHGGFIALGIGNGPQAGGGQALCPDALVDDGLLELTIVPTLEGEVGATMATLLADGKHAALDRVAVRTRLPWVEVASHTPLTLNLDGEPVTATRFRIECVAGRVRMHLPRDCALLAANGACTP